MKIPGKAKRILTALIILTLAASAALVIVGSGENIITAEVAVVLGNEVYADGKPAPRLAARLRRAADLYTSGQCSTIIVSGGLGRGRVEEAPAMADYLINVMGIPQKDIVIDISGDNTWMTAVFTAGYLRDHNLNSVIAVSQYFHLPRTVMAFEAAGCPNVGQARPFFVEFRDVYSILREIPAIVYYWLVYP